VVQWKSDRLEKSRQRWVDAAYAAAKQSRRARFPIIAPLADSTEVVARIAGAQAALVMHESATQPIAPLSASVASDVLLVVGPEGGLSAGELTAFAAAGAAIVRLGPTVLRTSSAGMAAVAALLAGSPRWAITGTDMEG
jgi:16S rRNA (uracil1498-N3)-methyltransferase